MQQYLNPHQSRERPPTDYENLLGDAIEQAYAAGVDDLPGLVARLNAGALPSPSGGSWTEELFRAEMHRLGA
jgi:hypothetical protein